MPDAEKNTDPSCDANSIADPNQKPAICGFQHLKVTKTPAKLKKNHIFFTDRAKKWQFRKFHLFNPRLFHCTISPHPQGVFVISSVRKYPRQRQLLCITGPVNQLHLASGLTNHVRHWPNKIRFHEENNIYHLLSAPYQISQIFDLAHQGLPMPIRPTYRDAHGNTR